MGLRVAAARVMCVDAEQVRETPGAEVVNSLQREEKDFIQNFTGSHLRLCRTGVMRLKDGFLEIMQ